MPTLGSKEAIFSFAQMALGEKRRRRDSGACLPGLRARRALRRRRRRDAPAARGARLAARPGRVRPRGTSSRSSGRATRTTRPAPTAPLSFYEELAARAREHGFLLCSDEAYSELWFDEPPVSALQVADRDERRRLQHALEALVDDRATAAGFVCAPAELADALRTFRPTVGTAPQEFVQRAGIAALGDERARRGRPRRLPAQARDARCPCSSAKGLRLAGGDATFFLWLAVDGPSEAFARRLLEPAIVVAPGSFFGPAGEGYVRMALVPTQEECERAAAILEAAL